MCLVALSWRQHERYTLVLGANRDEFRARPSAAAAWWPDQPEIYAGRDLVARGTWIGVTRQGRFAALTNIRDPAAKYPASRSRGDLVVDALLHRPVPDKSDFAGYNLLSGNLLGQQLSIDGNRPGQRPIALGPGLYGLSNGALDDPWPKSKTAKDGLAALLKNTDQEPDQLAVAMLELLGSRSIFADQDLPDTGIGLERERRLSPLYIDLPDYGTRCSTVLLLEHSGRLHFVELNHDRACAVPHITSFML